MQIFTVILLRKLRLVKVFKESGVHREDIKLISKSGIQLVTESRNNKLKHYNYSKEYIVWSAEQSLKKFTNRLFRYFFIAQTKSVNAS